MAKIKKIPKKYYEVVELWLELIFTWHGSFMSHDFLVEYFSENTDYDERKISEFIKTYENDVAGLADKLPDKDSIIDKILQGYFK